MCHFKRAWAHGFIPPQGDNLLGRDVVKFVGWFKLGMCQASQKHCAIYDGNDFIKAPHQVHHYFLHYIIPREAERYSFRLVGLSVMFYFKF